MRSKAVPYRTKLQGAYREHEQARPARTCFFELETRKGGPGMIDGLVGHTEPRSASACGTLLLGKYMYQPINRPT
jgi:hypothetical protein